MRDEPVRDAAGAAGETSGAEYLAADDRSKATGYNAVPHRAKQPPRARQVAEARRAAEVRPAESDQQG